MSGMIEVAKATVTVVPNMKGAQQAISSELGGSMSKTMEGEAGKAGEKSGKLFGGKLKAAMVAAGVGAALGGILSKSLDEGAKLQQSIGGVETLYGEAAGAIRGYAKEANQYGITANEYMEQSTSFAAALKQSLGGDVTAAAEAANTAISDMADNSAKFGTDVESLQMAYQGFAKGQYQLLDNLKLGYGGTKTEMERLLQDAQKISGQEYNIDNLSDVYEAIHVVQEEMGLTGVAAEEAKTTLSGSFDAMKASATDLMGNLMLGEDIVPSMKNLVETASTYLFDNLIPAVGNVIKSLPAALGTFFSSAAPKIGDQAVTLVTSLADGIRNNLPTILARGGELVLNLIRGMGEKIPEIAEQASTIVSNLTQELSAKLPEFASKGAEFMATLGRAIAKNLPKIVVAIAKVGLSIVKGLVKLVPRLMATGVQLMTAFARGLGGSVMNKIRGVFDKVKGLFDSFKAKVTAPFRFLSGLKIPKISISGGKIPFGIGGKGQKPSISVSWGARGGIIDSSTLIGIGAGEAGKEALLPLERNTGWMDTLAERINSGNTFNITLNASASESPEQYAQRFTRELRRQVRMGTI